MENVVVDKEIHDSIVVAEWSAGYITVYCHQETNRVQGFKHSVKHSNRSG